uniref:Tudor domain containing 6 n=1 Tax=Gasterosteus aculeatus aculeatus TaxID=481459 RepID=A0AAQ4S6G2_GASAC
MSSILGLPKQYSDVTVLINSVHLHPFCVLVEFWGKFSEGNAADYKCLAKEIQSPGKAFQEFEGNPGDQCLVEVDGNWNRSRIVSRNGSVYTVFLFDKGRTYSTTTRQLAWGKKNHFHLPPEVEFCVLANVLPLSPEKRWSPVALEFLKSLSGKSVQAHVQSVLVPHRTVLLHIPCISKQMYEMGIARKLSPDVFQDFVLMSLQSQKGARACSETGISMGPAERLHKKELFMYPELSAGTVETVIVTEVTNPHRVFCQLKVFSQELKKLSGQITQCCEGRTTNCIVTPDMIGFPCAARGSDGSWYRCVLQQVCPKNNMVEVLHVDYGTKQFVQMENVRPLAAEFFRMPVVTYICSLHGIIDKGVGWTTSQIDYLRTLLMQKTVIAKFEYQSISEGVYYVTLYGDENASINNLFGSKESCFLEIEKTLDYAIRNTASKRSTPKEGNQRKALTPVLSLHSMHAVSVKHISDPSAFWIQTQTYANEFSELMDSIYHLYKDPENEDVVKNPTVGLYCAAEAEDGKLYRAMVTEGGETQVKVFFVDCGNIKIVDRRNIRTLPDDLRKLPCLALKCSLAGVQPKDGKWSHSACDFFIKAVKDKNLTVHVTAKYDEGYSVQLIDPEAQGERDLGTLMCNSGHAERAEPQQQRQTKMTTLPALLPQVPDGRLLGPYSNKGMSFQATLNTVAPDGKERLIPTFKEHMFPIGSVIDVNVSYIKSPNDFWCQQVQNAGHLKLLMHDIQAHYTGSEFQPNVEMACVVRHPDNRMWYRALVIHKHETPDVDVLLVDYGRMETVSLYDLRKISPQFLALQGQAFRCSLLNPVDPTSAVNEWTEEATAEFHNFVETEASNFKILKCTIYAVMYSEQKIVFNIVDLETPFESVCTSMVNLVKSSPPRKAAGPSFRLDTYYYSTHNVKTGTEEPVTVTCVNSVHEFYCHLEKNADVIKDLMIKVRNLCQQLENLKLPTVFGTLCFVKYTDGHWYRGQIKATKPAILVHFVDYGDTIEVEKSDLLPVPREANDIMAVPVQAIACSLSDVPAKAPTEMNRWFETSATECKFRALVVAREPDGRLQVELYHGNTQVNLKIKKMFQIEKQEVNVVNQSQRALKDSENSAHKNSKVVPKQAAGMDDRIKIISETASAPTRACQMWNADLSLQSAAKPLSHVCESGRKMRADPIEFYIPPHKRQSCGQTPSGTESVSEPTGAHLKTKNTTETKPLLKSISPGTESQKESHVEKFPKLADLPPSSITTGMEADVYVSHCNSPLSFYVQLVSEEEEIFSHVEKLNEPQSTPQCDAVKDVCPGDLVRAEFADDSSWYRAIVREVRGKTMALVEFVDFGNTAIIPISRIGRLQEGFLHHPVYSTHCMLSDAVGLAKEEVLKPEVVSAFKDLGGNGEKVLKCHFVRQSGSVWEVRLEGVNAICKVPPDDGTKIASVEPIEVQQQAGHILQTVPEKSLPTPSPRYHQVEFVKGQRLEVYITAINDAQTFWCQRTDSEDLEKVTSSVSKLLDGADHKPVDPGSVSRGSLCIALFSDDGFWYRAEVIDKDGDELSVLFVDYGNETQLNFADVREMPPDLMETPPQAFLCELEGFDASRGSWDSGGVDALSMLTADKVLQLTVTRVTRETGTVKCLVRMECEGQVINEALKTRWRENQPGGVGATTLYQTSLQCDLPVKATAPLEDQLEHDKGQDTQAAVASLSRRINQSDELDPLRDGLPCNRIQETGLPQLHDKSDPRVLTVSCDKSVVENEAEGVFLATDMRPDDFNLQSDEKPAEAIGHLAMTDSEGNLDIMNLSREQVLSEESDKSTAAMGRDTAVNKTDAVKMIATEVVLSCCVLRPLDVPTEQEMNLEDGVAKETLPCVNAHVENDSMTVAETVAPHEAGYSAIETQSGTAASQDPEEEATRSVDEEEATRSEEEEATRSVDEEEGEATRSVDEEEEEATLSVGDEEEEEEATLSVGDEEEATLSVGDEEEATLSVGDEEEAALSVGEEAEAARFAGDEEEAARSVREEEAAARSVGEEEAAARSVGEEEAAARSVGEEEAAARSVGEEEAAARSVGEEAAAARLADVSPDTNKPSDGWTSRSATDADLSTWSAEIQREPQLPQQLTGQEVGDFSLQSEAMLNKTTDGTPDLHGDHLFALPSDGDAAEYAARCPDLSDLIKEVTGGTGVCRGAHQEAARDSGPPSPGERPSCRGLLISLINEDNQQQPEE